MYFSRQSIVAAGALLSMATAGVAWAASAPAARFLKAEGAVLRDREGGEVQLRGVNLGGWLEWQAWMCPMDSSKTLRDGNPGHNGYDFEVRKLLTRRFGAAGAENLLNVYQDAWLGTRDLDNIQTLGFNVVRLSIGYDTLLRDDGSWRPDAFTRMDWLVQQAWLRGLYTIIDFHAFLPPGADQNGGVHGYWSNAVQQAETVRIWQRIARHYRGQPAIAMFDLLNEPTNSQPTGEGALQPAAVCELYDRLYRAIRAEDPDHVIAMEGMWDWRTLREPAQSGYRNVVYSFHWYNWGGKTTADRNRATDNDLRGVAALQQAWHVPAFIGEFNHFGDKAAWKYALEKYDQQRLSWTLWTYKNTASGNNSWGVFTTIPGKVPPVPNLVTDSADAIRSKWTAWVTSTNNFALNPLFKPLLLPAFAQKSAPEAR